VRLSCATVVLVIGATQLLVGRGFLAGDTAAAGGASTAWHAEWCRRCTMRRQLTLLSCCYGLRRLQLIWVLQQMV
jgi:hypothetical protein